MQLPAPFEIVRLDPCGQAASNGVLTVTVLDEDGRIFRRRAIKGIGGGDPRPVEWAVVEIAGIRVYCDGSNVVVTRQEMMP